MSDSRPIGVFDSGVGGLSVLKHIKELLPNEHLFYVADSAYAPYGNKSDSEITQRSVAIAHFLIEKNIKALVVACNTATAVAIASLRNDFDIPVIGMEPAVKPAALQTQSGIVGILATTGTLTSQKFSRLYKQYASDVEIISQACPGLVEQVELADLTGEQTRALVQQYVSSLVDQGADTLVLGCTHYPFLKPLIEEIAGENISVIDTGSAIAKELLRQLQNKTLLNLDSVIGEQYFWSSQSSSQDVVHQLWNDTVIINELGI